MNEHGFTRHQIVRDSSLEKQNKRHPSPRLESRSSRCFLLIAPSLGPPFEQLSPDPAGPAHSPKARDSGLQRLVPTEQAPLGWTRGQNPLLSGYEGKNRGRWPERLVITREDQKGTLLTPAPSRPPACTPVHFGTFSCVQVGAQQPAGRAGHRRGTTLLV